VTVDSILAFAGVQSEAVLLVLLLWKCIFRTMPVFAAYICCSLGTDFAGWMITNYFPNWYIHFFIVNTIVDAAFFLWILNELARNVLSHNRAAPLPRPVVFALFVLIGLLMWSLAQWTIPPHPSLIWQLAMHCYQATAVLQVAAFLTLAVWSSLKGLRWPGRELQVATGLGFYAVVALAVVVLQTHQFIGQRYHWVDRVAPASYLGVLFYWVLYFGFATRQPVEIQSKNARIATRSQSTVGSHTFH